MGLWLPKNRKVTKKCVTARHLSAIFQLGHKKVCYGRISICHISTCAMYSRFNQIIRKDSKVRVSDETPMLDSGRSPRKFAKTFITAHALTITPVGCPTATTRGPGSIRTQEPPA